MSNDGSNRANWKNPDTLKLFIDLCVEEVDKYKLTGSSLKKDSWERIRAELKTKTKIEFTQKQIKNQWDYLKRKYQVWVGIVGKTGNTNIDPLTNKINWSDEKWEEEIKLNADVKQFKYKSLEHPEEMKALFDGILATGKDAWGPSKEGLPTDGLGYDEDAPILLDETKDVPCSSDVRNKRKRNNNSTPDDVEHQLLDAIKTLDKSKGPSLDECNKLLDEMHTLQEDDPLYMAATAIFCENETYREQWVKMSEKSEGFRKGWISMIARKLNLI